MKCNVCNSESTHLFRSRVLNKYDADYYRCNSCGFIEVNNPYWLEEAYSDAVSIFDVWSVSRPLNNSVIVSRFIDFLQLNPGVHCMDYGGGSGIFVRRMRDLGYPFFWSDAYSKNVYARGFSVEDCPIGTCFEFSTCFEVFEHMSDPVKNISEILEKTDFLFFSTLLVPAGVEKESDWTYFAPQHGQHISFHTSGSLTRLAHLNQCRFLSDGNGYHAFVKKNLNMSNADFIRLTKNAVTSGWRGIFHKGANMLLKWSQRRNSSFKSLTESDALLIESHVASKNDSKY